jgi:AraC-like DNA-binding protein
MKEDINIISNIGKAFRNNSDKKIVELDDKINLASDYQIHRIEHLVQEFNDYMPPNRMSHYFMAIVTDGTGEKSIGQYTFNVQPFTAMVVPVRGIHSSRNWSIQNKGYMLSFSDNLFIDLYFPKSFLNSLSLFKLSQIPYRYLSRELSDNLSAIFEEIIFEHNSSKALKKEMISLKIAELIIYYNRIFTSIEQIEGVHLTNDLYARFIDLLETYFLTEKSVKFYADILAIHANHLNSIVKKQSGYTAKENIQNRLLLEAKYLLASSTLTVKEIAFELGFEDQNYFSHFFKAIQKMTPLEYRHKPV